METAATLCRLNCGVGIKQTNHQVFLFKRNHFQIRKYSLPFSPLAEMKPLTGFHWPQRCSDKNHLQAAIGPNPRFNRGNGASVKCRVDLAVASLEGGVDKEDDEVVGKGEELKKEELPRETLIWRAAKLPMYTVALIPVTVATAAAFYQTGVFSLGRYLLILASYVVINVWVNLSNDVYDFDTGADKDKKESVVNLFGSRNGINFIAWSLLALGFSVLTWMAAGAGSLRAMVFVAAAVFGFYLYQCPPFRLSYYGVGEPLLFLAYGPFSTLGFYLLNSIKSELPISSTVVWSSILIGLTTALILFCSHFHQIKGDEAVGKMSPLVRLGTETGSHVVKWSIIGLYTLVFVLGMTKTLPVASVLLCAMTLPMGGLVVNFVQNNHKDNSKIFMGKYFCVRLHTIFGAALAAGLVAARIMTKQPVVV